MILDEIRSYLGEDWNSVTRLISESLRSDITLLNLTNDSILKNSGKQLRPMISLLVARACSKGNITQDSIRYAAAAELLHNATLLHDDVADCSAKRRGKPTVMSVLGSNASVLIGDFWLVKAMKNILDAAKNADKVIRIFSKTLSDLAEGEMLQLQKAQAGDTTEEDYLRIIFNKTASLFEAAAYSAAISVDAAADVVSAIREYSVNLGLAFQIRDDMFDYYDEGAIGKPVGIDLDEQKITLPLLCALESVSNEEAAYVRQKVNDIHENPSYKAEIRDFVFQHDGMEGACEKLHEYVDKAINSLSVLPDSQEKSYLAQIAEFTADRNK